MGWYVMRKVILVLAVVLQACFCASAQKYRMIWKDSFNRRSLDPDRWSLIPRGSVDWNRYMSDDESLYELKGGRCILRAIENDGIATDDTASFLTGGIYTRGKFLVTEGKVEVRARLGSGKSVWPAIWMLPQTGSWPDAGEIDLMEHLNRDDFIYQTVHSIYTQVLKKKSVPRNSVTAPIRAGRYNVFGVEIRKDCLVFSVNGKETMTYPRLNSEEYPPEIQFPFGTPYYILIDMQIGGSWVGPPVACDLPVEMEIDWIKVYSPK